MLRLLKRMAKKLPPFKRLLAERDQLREGNWVPPGHFYSPIPLVEELKAREQIIWGEAPRHLPSIDLNEEAQLEMFEELKRYYIDLPFQDKPQPHVRYYFDNTYFCYADAIVLYCMIRHLKPRKIIEIGSGYSSSVILDTNDLFFDGAISCTFV